MNTTMQAIIQTKYGSPDVLQLQDVAKPVPANNEVLIKIHATTVEAADVLFRQGSDFSARLFTGLLKPKTTRPGSEFAGEVEVVGKDVTRFEKGDQVFAATSFGLGAYAEYKCLPETGVLAIKPANTTYEEATAISVAGLEALHFLRQGNILGRQKVSINGAGGSIGTFAVQLAKSYGAGPVGCLQSARWIYRLDRPPRRRKWNG